MAYNRWDVVSVNFPFIEGMEAKRRPALIVSADRLCSDHGVYWIAMITTAKTGKRLHDVAITNLARAGLHESCVVRVARLMTVGDGQIARRVGEIMPKDRSAVSALLHLFIP